MGAKENRVVKLSPKFDPKRNISFGGNLEKEMIETFNTFDILWYAPENSEKLDEWKAFTNVIVTKVTKQAEFKTIALLGQMLKRYIVITTGEYAENTIPQIAELLNIKVIIYSMNVDYHKQWTKKIKYFLVFFRLLNKYSKNYLIFKKDLNYLYLVIKFFLLMNSILIIITD